MIRAAFGLAFISLFLSLFVPLSLYAEPQILKMKLQDPIEAPRWRTIKEPKMKGALAESLHALKLSSLEDRTLDCLSAAKKVKSLAKDLVPWVYVYELRCARSLFLKQTGQYVRLNNHVKEVRKDTESFLAGPQASFLKEEFSRANLVLLKSEIGNNTKAAWDRIAEINEWLDWISLENRKVFFQLVIDLALKTKKTDIVAEYQEKLAPPKIDPAELETPDVSPEEADLRTKLDRYLREKKNVEYTDLGVEFLAKFSASVYAERVTAQILRFYLALVSKEDKASFKQKEKMLKHMQTADPERIRDWSKTLFSREHFDEVLSLTAKARDKQQGKTLSQELLGIASDAAFFSGNEIKTREICKIILKQSSGTIHAARALFRLGHTELRVGSAKKAAEYFEQVLAHPYFDHFELSSMYWSWRAYQKEKSDRQKMAVERLQQKYPMSYFGLRARAELNGGQLHIPALPEQEIELSMTLEDLKWEAWTRILKLLSGGWFEEARYELLTLPEPESPEGKVIWAKVWASAFDYIRAAEILQRALTLKPSLLSRATLEIVYPREYIALVDREAKRYGIQKEIILGLMRQESGFQLDIVSTAGALGLMQLLPSTARELARDMRIKSSNIRADLIQPDFNIRLGTHYLNRRLRYFDGHVPLALGSYNAGIGNIRAWMRARADIKDLTKVQSSAPEAELWFDELPWSETSFYIKAILRNFLIYKALDQGDFEVSDPIWKLPAKG